MVVMVSATEPRFAGYTATREGVFADICRTVTYSDATRRNELVWQERTTFLQGQLGVYEQYEGARVHYPNLVEQSQAVWADRRPSESLPPSREEPQTDSH